MRKEKVVTITMEGRDKDKQFLLTEMPADQAERWAIRAAVLISHTDMGEFIPPNMLSAGWAALAYGALQALHRIEFDELKPLLDEMMTCVQALPEPSNHLIRTPLIDNSIEEVSTRFFLRAELFNLHAGFSLADGLSRWTSARTRDTSNTRTSRRRSARSSRVA
jgi:hypothetical protein